MTYDFNDIKDRVPIDQALAHYGVTLKVSGAKLVGCCPIHNGSNAGQFIVSADRRTWYCFGDCDRGGSVLDLIVGLEQCSISNAAKTLVCRHNI